MRINTTLLGVFASLGLAVSGHAQLTAADDFENYASNPVGASGGTGDWTGNWGNNSQNGGGSYLNTNSMIDGTKTLSLFGLGSNTGQSVSRPFPPCTNTLTIGFSMRGNYNVNGTGNPTNLRRMAFTVRSGNEASHFSNQRVSFFFAAGSTNFLWYDGTDRTNAVVHFATNHVVDIRAVFQPTNRAYSFVASNRNNGTAFSYAGTWSTGTAGDPLGSVAFMMRGPAGEGNDAFLDSVSVSAPDYAAPSLPGLPIREGDSWRYFKGTSTPAVQGTQTWASIGYDDGTWLGPAPSGFGYDDCDDGTALSDMQTNYLSVFTRRSFVVSHPAHITRLTAAVDYDDGAVIYLNGAEVARLSMGGGPVSHSSPGLSHESSRGQGASNPNPKTFITIDPSLLVAGTNVMAASVHNASVGSSDLSLIVELYTNTTLTRGPFIQMPRPGATAAIAWQTAAPGDGVVDYGLDLSYSSGTVSNSGATRDHTVHLSDLIPGTTYFYRVRSNGEVLHEAQPFRTRPAADQPFRVALIGDHGQGTAGMYAIASRINARQDIDAIFTSGDNVYGIDPCTLDGAPGWYDPYFFTLYGTSMRRVPLFPALGNHDWDTASGQYMVDYFRLPTNGPANHLGKNYSFEYGNMHITVIDTEPYEDNTTATMNEINAWLANDLAAATQRWRVAVLHRPPFTSQGNHNDHARVKEQIVPRLKAGGVQLVLQGHNHFYERINAIDGTHYVNTAGGGAALYPLTNIKDYSAAAYNARHSYAIMEVQGGRMKVQAFNDLDEQIDDCTIDIGPPFNLDGLLDQPAWLRASNNLSLYAAIRGHILYVATQDAGENNDHFLYMASALSTQRPANWAKSGTIMQWSAFLADENNSGFHGWFGPAGAAKTDQNNYNSMTAGLNNNGTNGNGVLEGTLNIPGHFGSWPTQFLFAAAPYGSLDGGALIPSAQVPAGDSDGHITSGEYLVLQARDLALDLPVAEAGPPQQVEAGLWAVLHGNASTSPAGFALSCDWQQMTGPAVVTTNLNQFQPAFVLTSNVAVNTDVTFRLRVHDGRFFSDDDVVTVTFQPMVDTDGDGLSDAEETTGYDNLLTAPNPAGAPSNPALPDSDGDGAVDGEEALAGTQPTNSNSVFKVVGQAWEAGAGGLRLDWNTVSGRLYTVEVANQYLTNPWTGLTTFMATSAVSRISDTNQVNFSERFYRIGIAY